MPSGWVFHCEMCKALPDDVTQKSLVGLVCERKAGIFVDAMPGRWLVWQGGGILGPTRYSCDKHRGDLVAELRYHYGTISDKPWKMPPYLQRWPDEKSGEGGIMPFMKWGLRGSRLIDLPRESEAEPGTDAAASD